MEETEYLVIDWNNLFVSSTLEDELLLFARNPDEVLRQLQTLGAEFEIQLQAGRTLNSYSGGEQAIICCLMLALVLPPVPNNVLLVHVLETLSPGNRHRLMQTMLSLMPHSTFYFRGSQGPRPCDEIL